MTRPDEEDAWRSIVENYGERPDLDDLEEPTQPAEPARPRFRPAEDRLDEPAEPARAPYDDPEDRFVPPPPPPIPRPTPRRALAWAGLVLAPLLMMVAAVLQIALPWVLDLGLVAAFVAGFTYLIATMGSGPSDPWDDGSRV